MKLYLRWRLINYTALTVALTLAALLLVRLVNDNGTEGFSFLICIAPWFFYRSRWFNLIPKSRKWLLGFHFLECLIFFLISSAAAEAFIYFHQLISLRTISSLAQSAILTPTIFSFVPFVFMPVNTRNTPFGIANGESQFNRANLKSLIRPMLFVGFFSVLVITIIKNGLRVDPAYYISAIIFGLFLTPMVPIQSIVMPLGSYKKMTFRLYVSAVFFVALFFAVTIGLLYFGRPEQTFTSLAQYALLRSSPPLSETRLLELARAPNGANLVQYQKLSEESKYQVSADDWTKRTAKCESQSCLDVSDMLIPAQLSEAEKFARFYEMTKLCKPHVKQNAVRCSGAVLSLDRLHHWFKVLDASPEIDRWLASNDVTRQLWGIWSLSNCQQTDEQISRIKALEDSNDEVVRMAARLHFVLNPKAPTQFKSP